MTQTKSIASSIIETSGYDSHQKQIEGALAGISRSGLNPFIDEWRKLKGPSAFRLVQDFKRTAYACGTINASTLACLELKLFVTTNRNQPKTRWLTAPVNKSEIIASPELSRRLKRVEVVEEILSHPSLDLLDNPNPHLSMMQLLELTQLYEEITGKAYWFHNFDLLDRPSDIWLIPTQFLEPKRNVGSKNIVDFYEFKNGEVNERYSPEDIIPFLMPCLKNPYLEGVSPLEASYENFIVESRQLAHESSMLHNETRPDAAFIPDKEAVMDDDQAREMEERIDKKFARGGQGKFIFMTEAGKIEPLQWPPRDLGKLEIAKRAKVVVCNTYQVPIPLLESEKVTQQQLKAAIEQHGKFAIKPRAIRKAGVLNKRLLPLFDTSQRMFFAFHNPVPEDEEQKLQENVQLGMNGFKTPNEVREAYNLQPHPDGDDLRPINVSPEVMRQNQRDSGSAEQ